MADLGKFRQTSCAICGPGTESVQMFPSRISDDMLTGKVFTARRLPNRIHGRVVRCCGCGLVRHDPMVNVDILDAVYTSSEFTYEEDVPNLNATYGRYVRRIFSHGVGRERMLEIGCGNGFFLEEAKRIGFGEVHGVEPSREAVEKAPPALKPFLKVAMFDTGLYPDNYFDFICLFQTLDHLSQPRAVLGICRRILKSGGAVLAINHDIRALPARILGERSPVIDIGHAFLYDLVTIRRLFEAEAYTVKEVFTVSNTHALGHWLWLAPLPQPVKTTLLKFLHMVRLDRIPMRLSAGNLGIIAVK